MLIPEYIKEADRAFYTISHNLHFRIINPINIDKTKKEFLKNKKDPLLEYNEHPPNISDAKETLEKFDFKNRPLDIIFNEKKKELHNKCDLYKNIGTEKFTKYAKQVWGSPDKKLIDIAYDLLDLKESIPSQKISAEKSISLIKNALREYKIEKRWKIQRKEIIPSCVVKYAENAIAVKKKERFSEKYIKRLIVHEIGTHILRYENSLIQPLKIFKTGFADYLTTEEGLAAYNENSNQLLSKSVLRQYAGRVIAVGLSLDNSFSEVFNELKRHFKSETALKLTLRVKRGISDTSLPGGCTKDHLYLKGYYEVIDYIEKGGCYEDLYIGKIAIRHIPMLKKISEIRPPKFIPHSINQSSINSFWH